MAAPTRVINARDVRNQLGFNGSAYDNRGVAVMDYIGFRYWRGYTGDAAGNTAIYQNFANLCVSSGLFDPNIHFQVLIDAYWQSSGQNPAWNWAWTPIQQPILKALLPQKNQNGTPICPSIEGPNEIGDNVQGGGTVFPDTFTNVTFGNGNSPVRDPTSQSCFLRWAQVIHDFKVANPSLFTNCEIVAPTIVSNGGQGGGIADFWGGIGYAFGGAMDVHNLVDYGCFHCYLGADTDGTTFGHNPLPGSGSLPWGYLTHLGHKTSQSGNNPNNLSMVISECGAFQFSNNYAADHVSSAWGTLLYMCDHFGFGGRRILFYGLTPGSGNPGLSYFNNGDPLFLPSNASEAASSAYPRTKCLRNWQTLVSIGNNYKDTRNLIESGPNPPSFVPGYTGTGFSVSGMTQPGDGANAMIMPKSDGTTMIVVWREPHPIDTANNGNGTGSSANTIGSANVVTVNFGSLQTYNIWDPSGGSGGNNTTITDSPTKLAGPIQGTSATLNMFNVPLFIELVSTPPTQKPDAPTGVTLGIASATSQTISWPAAGHQPATYTLQIQPLVSTGAWTNIATIDAGLLSYTYLGLIPNTLYFYRLLATNSFGDSAPSSSVSKTTNAAITQSTQPVIPGNNYRSFRSDNPTTSPITLSLPIAPSATSSVFVFFNGYSGGATGGNNSSIVAPAGAVIVSGPNYDPAGGEEVTICWQLTSNITSNSFVFSGFDTLNNAGWKIVEVTNVSSLDANHGPVSSASATAISWPLIAPAFPNCVRLSQISITFASTNGTPSAGVTSLVADPATVGFHQDVLYSISPTTTTASIARTGGNAADQDSYLSLNIYGATLPSQVTGLVSSNVTTTSVGLSWNSLGSTVTSYTAQISANNGSTWTTSQIIPATTSNTTISNLTGSTPYQFRVFGNNNSGPGPVSAALNVTTPAVNALQIIQSALASDTVGTANITVTLPKAPVIGNLLIFYLSTRNLNNTGLLPPTGPGFTTILPITTDVNSDSAHMMWSQVVNSTGTSFSYANYFDLANLTVVEVQGVSSVDSVDHHATLTYTDGANGNVQLPITLGSSTPFISLYFVLMDIIPASYGTLPTGFTKLQGNVSATTTYHQTLLLQVASSVVTGTYTIPFVAETGVTQGGPPMSAGVHLIGTSQLVAPGGTTLTFGTATTNTQPLSWVAATGTVTGYKISYSLNATMATPTVVNVTGLSTTITGLQPNTQYFYTIQAFNSTVSGPLSAVQNHTTAAVVQGPVKKVIIGGKLVVVGGKIQEV